MYDRQAHEQAYLDLITDALARGEDTWQTGQAINAAEKRLHIPLRVIAFAARVSVYRVRKVRDVYLHMAGE